MFFNKMCFLVLHHFVFLSFIRPVYQASLSDQFIRPVYQTSLSDQFIRPVYQNSLSEQFIRPVHQASLSSQFIRPVYQTSLSDQFIRPVYQDSLSCQFIRPVYQTISSSNFIRPVHQASSSGQFITPVYHTSLLDQFIRLFYLVPRLASAVTKPVVRARGAGSPTDVQKHSKLPFKGLRDPEEMVMDREGGERTRTGTRDVKAAASTVGPRGARAHGAITKILFR